MIRRNPVRLDAQHVNMRVVSNRLGNRQYRVTIVTKTFLSTIDDRWCIIEAYPERLKHELHRRIVKEIGKCRLIN